MITSFTLAGRLGMDAAPVTITETTNANTTPNAIHGDVTPMLAKELLVRVRSALLASDWAVDVVSVTIDAAGAKIQVPALDLAIALEVLRVAAHDVLVVGELGLDGKVRSVRGVLLAVEMAKRIGMRGVLLAVEMAKRIGMRGVLVPSANLVEAQTVEGIEVYEIAHLRDARTCLAQPADRVFSRAKHAPAHIPDFSEVRGNALAVDAVAAAMFAGQSILLSGAPGTGKTMIARRAPGLLPRTTLAERLEVTRVYSALGLADGGLIQDRPFRAPHHTISAVALMGGGTSARPGEAHLATHGVLFLDEVTEFSRGAIEALAGALDAMPIATRPILIAAANKCACGWLGSEVRECTCSKDSILRYQTRVEFACSALRITRSCDVLSVSLADMRDLATEVQSKSTADLIEQHTGASL